MAVSTEPVPVPNVTALKKPGKARDAISMQREPPCWDRRPGLNS